MHVTHVRLMLTCFCVCLLYDSVFWGRHQEAVAAAGGNKALIQLGEEGHKHFSMKGFKSYLAWRSAYLTRLGNAQNRLYVLINWLTTTIFGRDMSRW